MTKPDVTSTKALAAKNASALMTLVPQKLARRRKRSATTAGRRCAMLMSRPCSYQCRGEFGVRKHLPRV